MAGSRGARPAASERLSRLARLGLRCDDDLALHLPLRYLDLTRVVPIAQARTGDEVQIEGVIRRQEITGRGRRVLSAELEDDSGRIALRLFNFYPSQLRQLAVGQRVRAFGHVRAGALQGLATTASKRAKVLPDVPTVREQGFASLELEGWNGFFAPARTPAPIMARLQREIAAAAAQPDFIRRCDEVGAEAVGSDSESFGAMVRAQAAKIRDLVASVQLKPE